MSEITQPSLLTLAKSGYFGGVRFGMSQEKVREILGNPDDTGGASRRHPDNLWKYGDIELGFSIPDLQLFHIAINFWGEAIEPEQGKQLRYDTWVIRGGLDIETFTQACYKHNIQFKELLPPWNDGCREFTTLFDKNNIGSMHLIFADKKEYEGQTVGLFKIVASSEIMKPKNQS